MDQNLRAKLDELAAKQASFQAELKKLGARSFCLEEEIAKITQEAKDLDAQKTETETEQTPIPEPPPLPSGVRLATTVAPSEQPVVSKKPKAAPESQKHPAISSSNAPKTSSEKPKPAKQVDAGEWELNFGRVWLVRIGVLLLLTGLIFLSTYAYKNWLFHAGAAMKVTFFMTISVALTALGLWLENWKTRFQQYGRVVASGGLAAGYYTIYAAHFVPALKLIESPILEGVLLTLWAALILAYAVWKQSRVVAVIAIGLAFYGTIVNPSGWLSLFSALLLSASGIWLMLRFRWVSIGLGVVAAAYASHAYWLGLYPGEATESVRLTYLACYWLLFTVALMVPQARELPEQIQRWMVALNNAAAWYLTVFSIPSLTPHAEIGWISLGMGVVWIGLAVVARSGKLWHQSLAVIFGYQGLMIASLGVLIEATGYTRCLVLAVEACVLLLGAKRFGGVLARCASVLMFGLALIAALPEMNGDAFAPWLSYAALALVCAVYTGIVKRDDKMDDLAAILPAVITWIVLGAGVFSQWQAPAAVNGIWLAATVVMLSAVLIKNFHRLAGLQELAVISVPVSLIAGWWYLDEYQNLELWQSIIPILGAGVFWYMWPKMLDFWNELTEDEEAKPNAGLEWVFSVMLWLMVGVTANDHMQDGSGWLILGGLVALSGRGLAEYFKRRSIAGPAQIFHAFGLISLVEYGNEHSLAGWVPTLLFLVHLVIIDLRWKMLGKSLLMGFLAFGLTVAVSTHAFQEFDRPDLTLTALGLLMAAWAFHRREIGMLLTGSVFPLILANLSAVMVHPTNDWLRYLPVLSSLVLHAMLWRETKDDKEWKPCRVVLLISGLVTLFIASSIHVQSAFDGAGLAICWALLASLLFGAGLAIRCRPYRLIGLWWLAAAVLHVVCIDVMRLGTLGRILSFITLGLVLLAFGFLYNRFQESIRKFL